MFLVIKDVIHFFTEPKCRGYFSQDLVDVSHVNLFAHFSQIYIRNRVGGADGGAGARIPQAWRYGGGPVGSVWL